MISFFAFFIIYITFNVSYSWTWNLQGGMLGLSYGIGGRYEIATVCPQNVSLGYYCDASSNDEARYLNGTAVESFCEIQNSTQVAFGTAVIRSQICGECAQLRVLRTDGEYNQMTVMMVDSFSFRPEIGDTELESFIANTGYQRGNFVPFEYQLVTCPDA